ncbi:hypothetical protein PTKIN_Ptkin15bG0044700 [Pterospermum kingtungense]
MAKNLHVAMLPWSAFGHLIPFFQLSIGLAKSGVKVSFISTPKNIQRLPQVPPTLANLIDVVALPLPPLDNQDLLPDGREATVDVPSENIQYLKIACDLLQHPFKQFISDQRPDWIFTDQSFPVADAEDRVEHSKESLTTPPELGNLSSSVAYRSFEAASKNEDHWEKNVSGISDVERYVGIVHAKKPEGRRITDKSWIEKFEWLDGQKPKSVVFIGFGSECKLSKEQVHKIADALELSGLPFIWALRKPDWATDDIDALPLGFDDRTRGRGLVCMGWAPQLFLVEKGLAVEVERRDDGSFSGGDIAKALRLAMVSEERENTRIRAKEAAQVFGNQNLQDFYFDRFVEYLKKNGEPATEPRQ